MVVGYLAPSTMPTYVFQFRMLLGIDQNLHSFIEERVRFRKVEHVKPDLGPSCGPTNSIKEPLSVPRGIHIILKQKVIVIVIYF
jgi:hypothetical protein